MWSIPLSAFKFIYLTRLALLPIFFTCLASTHVAAQSQSPFFAGRIPLAVRSPYLNAWQTNVEAWPQRGIWPFAFNSVRRQGWQGFVQVDQTGETYEWLGGYALNGPNNHTSIINGTVTPTRTIVELQAGPLQIKLTFLSPIEPSDLIKQSFPFSYLSVETKSTDGNTHSVRLYAETNNDWVSGVDSQNKIQWETHETNDAIYHTSKRSSPEFMIEQNDVSEYSTFYHAIAKRSGITYQTGANKDLRDYFIANGSLQNIMDTQYRSSGNRTPSFSFAVDLGTVADTYSEPTVFTIGLVRDPLIRYAGSTNDEQLRSSMFRSKYGNDMSTAINDFLTDFPAATERAIALDQRIMNDASSVSSNYVDVVSLAARQAMAATEITISNGNNGQWNLSDTKMFMRDMGVLSSASGARVNPVETIYAALPMYLYLNASWIGLLLDPMLQYQSSPAYSNSYAAPDLGLAYPNATGNAQTHSQRVEHTSSMLIMTYAHALFSGDGGLIARYPELLKKWADYLVDHTLMPSGERSIDTLEATNSTNLAVKGIIAIKAMSEISAILGKNDDAKHYTDIAADYISQWHSFATSTGSAHLSSFYGTAQSDGFLYNLYADKLLQTNLVPQAVYNAQADLYANQVSSADKYGLPHDSGDLSTTSSAWTLFTAASVADSPVSGSLIDMVHVACGETFGAFPSLYNTKFANITSARGSAAQGAMFAHLALKLSKKTVKSPAARETNSSRNRTVRIAVGVVGGILALALLAIVLWFVRRRKTPQQQSRINLEQENSTFVAPFSNFEPTPTHILSSKLHMGPMPVYMEQQNASSSKISEKMTSRLSSNLRNDSSSSSNPSSSYANRSEEPVSSTQGTNRQMYQYHSLASVDDDERPPPQYHQIPRDQY